MSIENIEEIGQSELQAVQSLLQLARAFLPTFALGAPQLVSSPPAMPGTDNLASRIQRAELRYKTLVEQLPAITFLASFEKEKSEIYVSAHIEQVLGYTAKEWVENPILWYQRLHSEDKARWNLEFARTVSSGEPFGGDYRFRAKEGNVVWIRGQVTLVRDESGRPSFLQGLGYDITELKQAEEVLRLSKKDLERLVEERSLELIEVNESLQNEINVRKEIEQDLRAALKAQADIQAALDSHSIVATTDRSGKITYVNDHFCEISKYSRAELLGQDHRLINSSYHPTEFIANLWKTILSGKIWKGEICNRAKDGTLYWVATTIVPFLDDLGKPVQFVAIRTDMTERKLAEEQLLVSQTRLLEANRDLAAASRLAEQRARETEAAARVKSEFLANMSHEIRTPMNGVIATAELLSETSLTPEQREDLETIIKCGKSLLIVINDILDFSKIEAGKVTLDPHAFGLQEFVARIGKLLGPRIAEKGIAYCCELDESLPSRIVTDETRLGQILLNIIGNAVKFTPASGKIAVAVRRAGNRDKQMRLTFSVADSGIGIAQDKLRAIFQPFSQADTSTTRLFGGTGLGLTISRALVQLLGGELEVQSVPDQGTVFSFTLPVEAAPEEVRPNIAAAARAKLKLPPDLNVLVAEDNVVNAKLIMRLLQKYGLKPTLAVNGQEAVNAYIAAGQRRFDLIFMDVQMPVLDGFEATAMIRKLESQQQESSFIVALTAHAMAEDRDRCINVGMDDFMTKPVERLQLERILSRWHVQ